MRRSPWFGPSPWTEVCRLVRCPNRTARGRRDRTCGPGEACRAGRCRRCRRGFKRCNGRCIPQDGCCGGCPANQICHRGSCCLATSAALAAALGPGGPDTIRLCPQTTYQGTFIISRNVRVRGAGPASTKLDGGGAGPVVTVTAVVSQAELRGLGIVNGVANEGGGILNQGTLTVVDSAMIDNAVAGAANVARGGGGIENFGRLTLTDSALVGNTSATTGGAVTNWSVATLTRCRIEANAARWGGGITNLNDGDLTLVDCALIGNTAGVTGGGLDNLGVATLDNSRLIGNSAGRAGGGIVNVIGQITLRNGSRIGGPLAEANRAPTGAGMFNDGSGSALVLDASHVTGNIAGDTNGVGGIGLDSRASPDDVTIDPGSTVRANQPCDCDFADPACGVTCLSG